MLIGINGKLGSGKDTVGKIIQIITFMQTVRTDNSSYMSTQNIAYQYHNSDINEQSDYVIKKFADKLKDTVCLWIGCTREQLEEQDFKNTALGSEWNQYAVSDASNRIESKQFASIDAAESFRLSQLRALPHLDLSISEVRITPRYLLQVVGTDCGRDMINQNIWVNSLFAEYTPLLKIKDYTDTTMDLNTYSVLCRTCDNRFHSKNKRAFMCSDCCSKQLDVFPNWLITDMRFPNELAAVKSKGGYTIRVNREQERLYAYRGSNITFAELEKSYLSANGVLITKAHADANYSATHTEHESETALDKSVFDFTIDNSGTIEELIDKVRTILTEIHSL